MMIGSLIVGLPIIVKESERDRFPGIPLMASGIITGGTITWIGIDWIGPEMRDSD